MQLLKKKSRTINLINVCLQPLVDFVRVLFEYFGTEQPHTLSFTHISFPRPFDYAGSAADGLITGPGKHICTLHLDGLECYVFVQKHPRVAQVQQCFPVLVFWKMATNDLWV